MRLKLNSPSQGIAWHTHRGEVWQGRLFSPVTFLRDGLAWLHMLSLWEIFENHIGLETSVPGNNHRARELRVTYWPADKKVGWDPPVALWRMSSKKAPAPRKNPLTIMKLICTSLPKFLNSSGLQYQPYCYSESSHFLGLFCFFISVLFFFFFLTSVTIWEWFRLFTCI